MSALKRYLGPLFVMGLAVACASESDKTADDLGRTKPADDGKNDDDAKGEHDAGEPDQPVSDDQGEPSEDQPDGASGPVSNGVEPATSTKPEPSSTDVVDTSSPVDTSASPNPTGVPGSGTDAGTVSPGDIIITDPQPVGEPAELCSLPLAVGDCDDSVRRYYYDSRARRCQRFFYTGCGGNENNFEEGVDCATACGQAAPCGCVTDDEQCQPDSCDLCPAELSTATGSECTMVGLECRADGSTCVCEEGEAGLAWRCDTRL